MQEDGVQREAMRLRSDDSREAARLWFAAPHVSGAICFYKDTWTALTDTREKKRTTQEVPISKQQKKN